MQLDQRLGTHQVSHRGWLTRIEAIGDLTHEDAQQFCKLYEKILTEQSAIYVLMFGHDAGHASPDARRQFVKWQQAQSDPCKIFVAVVSQSLLLRAAVTLIMSAMAVFSRGFGATRFFSTEASANAWLEIQHSATETACDRKTDPPDPDVNPQPKTAT